MINVGLFIKKDKVFDSGVNETDANFKIIDSTKTWTTNQWVDYYIRIIEGTGVGYYFKCTSNNSTILQFDALPFNLDTTSVYEIYTQVSERVELFKEEKISVTSQIANANDIGKVFTDFSQSFTIPASARNNKILSHWYESSIDDGFDHRVRYDAYIEIDTHKFKDGNLQLEKASKKNGFIESYTVTFYGNLTQLKDIIQDDKLSSLDFSIYNHSWDYNNVITRITSATTTGDIKYPLIGSKRKFYYKDVVHASEDVTTNAGSINWNELFPAIKVSNIFLRIKAKYGVDFTGSFLNEDQWKKLYLYLKPSTELNFLTQPLNLNFTSTSGASFPELYLVTDTLTTNFDYWTGYGRSNIIRISLTITPSSGYATIPYTIYVYKNDVLFTTLSNLVGTTTSVLDELRQYDIGNVVNKYTFSLSASATFYFTPLLTYQRSYFNYTLSTRVYINSTATSSAQNTIANIQIGNYMPDMKIADFLTGIIKAFNLMVIPKGNNVFDLSHLETYYNAGKILDITQYTYSDEMEIERPKLFKSINLTYEKSSNVLNNAFRGLWGTEYGDLIYNPTSSNESTSYDIKLPFENVMFERAVGTEFQTATIIDKDLKPYIPKPMLIYCNGLNTSVLTGADRIIIKTPATAPNDYYEIGYYNRFSNEYDSFPTDVNHSGLMTMNFGNEVSPWYGVLAPKGLYFRQYKNYIDNLYNIKTRIIKIKALLPSSLISSNILDSGLKSIGIALNDRLIIRNKRYIINNFTTDLTTGEANFELITDYRGFDAASSVGYRFATYNDIQTNKETIDFETVIYLNDYDSFGIKGALNFLSYPTTGLQEYGDFVLPITIPANTSGIDRYDQIGIDYYNKGILQVTESIIVFQTAI